MKFTLKYPSHFLTVKQRLLEASFLFGCALALFLLIALVSFHPQDSGWIQTGKNFEIQNHAGSVGAWLSDFLLATLGYAAYAIPLITAGLSWLFFRHYRDYSDIHLMSVGIRLVGGFLCLFSCTSLFHMNLEPIHYYSAGGYLGTLLSDFLIYYLNWTGATLILLYLFVVSLTFMTGLTLAQAVDYIGEKTIHYSLIIFRFLRQRNDALESLSAKLTPLLIKIRQIRIKNRSTTFLRKKNQPADKNTPSLVKEKSEKIELPVADLTPEIKQENESFLENTENKTLFSMDDQTQEKELFISLDEEISHDEPEIFIDNYVEEEPVIQANEIPTPFYDESEEISLENQIDDILEMRAPVSQDLGLPDLSLLDRPNRTQNPISDEELAQIARLVESKLEDFNIKASVVNVCPGPVITRFELDLAPGVKVSKITALSKDLARSLSAVSVRVVEVIPGKSVIGLELPNLHRETVHLSNVLDCEDFHQNESALTMVLGGDISGQPVVVDLAKMPHLLVAGTTGSGKSVGVNVMILSLLYKSAPEDVRMIMIDPKMLELSVYEGIPHLLCEVVTDMKEASNALRWCVGEMERRYQLMSALGVRNLKGFNAKIKAAKEKGEPIVDPLWDISTSMHTQPPVLEKLPAIVVVVDEFADMMMIVGKKVEELIARIAQKARAAGIHLILATQRPSVDVITGLIKANVPTRIAFQVSSKIDSRTILDQQGAETLLGMGDMLYLPPGTGVPIRVHGAFVDDHEVHRVVADWKQRAEPQYIETILKGSSEAGETVLLPGETPEGEQDLDVLYDEAVAFVTETRRGSISSVQRKFKIGYNRAARMIEQMEANGVVSAPLNNGNREVLAPEPAKV